MSEIVIALYKPHPGKDAALRDLIKRHMPVLQDERLVTDRKPVLMQSADGVYLEIFEWVSETAAKSAHDLPEVAAIWDAMGEVCDFVTLNDLKDAGETFPHFSPVTL